MTAIPTSGRAGQAEGSALFVAVHGDYAIAHYWLLSRTLYDDSDIGVIAGTCVGFVVFLAGREAVAQRSQCKLQRRLGHAVGETESDIARVLAFAAVAFRSADFEGEWLVNAGATRGAGRDAAGGGPGRRGARLVAGSR